MIIGVLVICAVIAAALYLPTMRMPLGFTCGVLLIAWRVYIAMGGGNDGDSPFRDNQPRS